MSNFWDDFVTFREHQIESKSFSGRISKHFCMILEPIIFLKNPLRGYLWATKFQCRLLSEKKSSKKRVFFFGVKKVVKPKISLPSDPSS